MPDIRNTKRNYLKQISTINKNTQYMIEELESSNTNYFFRMEIMETKVYDLTSQEIVLF